MAAIKQGQEDRGTAERMGLATREPEKTIEAMMVAIRDSLSDLASSDDGEDREDEDDAETEHGKLSKDDELGWVIGTISRMVQQRMERFQQQLMELDE